MSDKTVAEKLFLKPGRSLLVVNGPTDTKSTPRTATNGEC